jgi:hypothetical protein
MRMHFSIERAALAASFALALGSGCSSGDGGSSPQGPRSSGGATAGGQTSTTAGSGNSGGQNAGAGGASGSGGVMPSSGGATTSGGASGVSGASGASGTTATGGGGMSSGGGGIAGTGAAPSGGATTVPDGGECCKTADCQPDSVKTCVCTTWGQSPCCGGTSNAWDGFCQGTAEVKCGAEKCGGDTSTPTPDGGHILKGACCATHVTPGCDDMAIEQCVCALVPDCCKTQWADACVQLVREQHCDTTVRDCVCMWQSGCCDQGWTDSCNLVATGKCAAKTVCP